MTKCIYCGKDFNSKDGKKYCSENCSYLYKLELIKTKYLIKSVAKKYDFEIRNLNKIINAKLLMFLNKGTYRCPCDGDNSERFCGSALCIADVVYKGHCHCNLFWSKKTPLICDIEILKKKLLQIKPELEGWIEQNF